MSNSVVKIPVAINEPVLSYAPSSAEKKLLKEEIVRMKQSVIEIPMWIGGDRKSVV